MKQKYSIDSIQNSKEQTEFLFFWGHQQSRNGEITKSCFSQWWISLFEVNGIEYKTAEHYMMAEKARLFGNDLIREKIINANTPAEAKKLGRQVTGFDQDVWELNRFEIVKKANLNKFNQNKILADFLLKTNESVLVEASPVDPVWGIGIDELI